MKFTTIASTVCAAFYAVFLLGLAHVDYATLEPVALVLIVPLSIFIADFLSGVVHVFFDYYPINREAGFYEMFAYQGNRGTPEYLALMKRVHAHPSTTIIDRLSYGFKIHHIKPRAMNRKTYAVHMLETVLPAFLAVLSSFAFAPEVGLTLLLTGFMLANVQFVHACVHDTHRSVFWKKVVHVLQKLHIVYSLDTHMVHHRHGVSNFCLITGWANFLLNPAFRLLVRYKVIDPANWVSLTTLRLPGGTPADH